MEPSKKDEKLRVLYLIQEYPQLSQTYVHEEVESLKNDYDIKILTWKRPNLLRKDPHPYEFIERPDQFLAKALAFKPHIMHSHYFHQIEVLEGMARQLRVPYTLRTHSFDILKPRQEKLAHLAKITHSPYCLRVLCFPDFKERLLRLGIPEDKLFSSWPVVNCKFFFNPEKPAPKHKIMNVGAALDKKNYKGFIDLASLMQESGNEFNLYVMGYEKDKLVAYNESKGNPVKTITSVEYREMPAVYRAHDWLVYTGDPSLNTIGLPMAVAEAQSSGIGVCLQEMPGRKEALLDYLGGAGFLFKTVEELPEILSKPYPDEMRLKGLENAKKSDINVHKVLLTEVWDRFK